MQGMCRRASAAGAFLGIAHPQWYGLTVEDALSIPEAHAVEVYNHGCAVESGRGDGWVVHDEALARGARLNAYAADDAHFGTPDAGGGWVMVKAETLEPEPILDALKRGDFYSSQGPEIHDIAVSGEEVQWHARRHPGSWPPAPAPACAAPTGGTSGAPPCRSTASARTAISASP
jgi:hypothetical protein